MPKIKQIEVDYNEVQCQGKILCIKIQTNKGIQSDFVELPENPEIRDVINAVNLLLSRCKDMTI